MNTIEEDRIIHFPAPDLSAPTLEAHEWRVIEDQLTQCIKDAEDVRYKNDELLNRLSVMQRFIEGMRRREDEA